MAVQAPPEPRVTEGEEVGLRLGPDGTRTMHAVLPAHEGGQGHWYCAVHEVGFQNNIGADSHAESSGGGCRWAWICWEHGPEVP
jgi:hypothetical protein